MNKDNEADLNKEEKNKLKDTESSPVVKESEEENILDSIINENVSFGWEHIKMIFLLILYLIGEGFVMIGISLIIPVVSGPWILSEFDKGFAGGSIFMGFTLGAITAGIVSDTKGRKIAFIIGNIFSILGGLIGIFAEGIKILSVSNVLVGFGIGISIPSIFSLCCEITNARFRSIIIGLIWIVFVFGEISACTIAKSYEIYNFENQNWKKLLIFRCFSVFNKIII
jgi:MFS family permease